MIGYLLRRLSEVPDGNDWLTPAERQWFTDRRSAKRVADWRLGRWTAKAAARAFLGLRGRPIAAQIEVLAAADGAPELHADGHRLPLSISLSHSAGRGLCAVADASIELGCDLERLEPRSPQFVDSYLTGSERAALRAARPADRELMVNLVWSAKESALKALREGLRADTRSLEVSVAWPSGAGWGRFEAVRGKRSLAGRWTRLDGLVATIVSRPAPEEIVDLDDSPGLEPAGAETGSIR